MPSVVQESIPQAQTGSQSVLPPAQPTHARPAWALSIPLAMHVYLSTSPTGEVFANQWTSERRDNQDDKLPHFVWENITYGDWSDTRTTDFVVDLPVVSPITMESLACHIVSCRAYKPTAHYGRTYSWSKMEPVPTHLSRISTAGPCTIPGNVSLRAITSGSQPYRPLLVLTRYLPKAKVRKVKSLISGQDEQPEEEEEPQVSRDHL